MMKLGFFISSEVIDCSSTALISLNSCNICTLESTWYLMKIFFFCFPIQRLPFSVGFIGCMVGTIYVSMMLHSYFLSVIFSVLQVCPSNAMFDSVMFVCERSPVLVHFMFFPFTARLEHAAYLNNESMSSSFKGDSDLFCFSVFI